MIYIVEFANKNITETGTQEKHSIKKKMLKAYVQLENNQPLT